ncbi:MAG: hypothetical protein K2X74_15835 [Acetobacteraceae bacterium]|nr:hypothetical protein [Acetobacteraceae bacterium]
MIRRFLCALVFGIAACAAPPAPPLPEPEPPLPPLAQAAVEEWAFWGRITVDGWPDDRPGDRRATPERFERLLDYWYAVPGGAV